MPSYSTTTGENTSSVSMGAGTSLFRRLLSVGSGFTVTGFDLRVAWDGEASAVATGLTTGVPVTEQAIKFGLSFGPATFTPPALLANPDDPSLLWWSAGEEGLVSLVVPASTSWQAQSAYRRFIRSRYQFRLAAASDFCLQVANASINTQAFGFLASLRVSWA